MTPDPKFSEVLKSQLTESPIFPIRVQFKLIKGQLTEIRMHRRTPFLVEIWNSWQCLEERKPWLNCTLLGTGEIRGLATDRFGWGSPFPCFGFSISRSNPKNTTQTHSIADFPSSWPDPNSTTRYDSILNSTRVMRAYSRPRSSWGHTCSPAPPSVY